MARSLSACCSLWQQRALLFARESTPNASHMPHTAHGPKVRSATPRHKQSLAVISAGHTVLFYAYPDSHTPLSDSYEASLTIP